VTKTHGRRPGLGILGLLLPSILFVCPCAWALDPALDVSQYAHTSWRVRDGFAQGAITSIAQTPDGYLWLGTEFGLYRFDGVRAVPWLPPAGERLPSIYIRNVLVARDGTLWIATQKGLASWKDGKLTDYPEMAGQMARSLLEDREGTIWVGSDSSGMLCAVHGGKVQCHGGGSFGGGVVALYEDPRGNLWVSATTGIWRWKPGPPERYLLPRDLYADGLIEGDNGTLLLATIKGLKQFTGGKIQDYAISGITGQFRPIRFFRSSDGSLWIASQQGLLHVHQGKTDGFGAADGLSGDGINVIFEDQEGNVWVTTMNGLDRFREYAVPRISRNQGLSNLTAWSVQATQGGGVWIGTAGGLNRWQNGHVTVFGPRSPLGQSRPKNESELSIAAAVRKIANVELTGTPRSLGLDDRGRLYVSTQEGIFHFEGDRFIRVPGAPGINAWAITGDGNGKLWVNDGATGLYFVAPGEAVQLIPWSRFGQKGFGPESMLADRSSGGLWLGFNETGVAYFKDGQVRASYTSADGLGNGRVNDLRFGSRGTLWAATEGGLSRIRDGRVMTLTSKNGLPCDEVHWSVEDDDHFVWVYMTCGLARIGRSELDAWVTDPSRKVELTVFDTFDGVGSVGVFGGYGPRVTKAPSGKIWFVHRDGVSVIDPRHLPYNKVPPPVHIEQITADRKTYDRASYGRERVPLPARIRDLQIEYTALSLVAPEKVRFRYKLEGRDRDWQDAGNRRQAFYTDLPPRNYRFRVMACNNSGVWNETGAFLDFSVAPAYYQTWWFRLSLVAAIVTLLWGLYQLRLRQMAREFNAGVEARVNERTRIARELHDSMLQGFQGLMFRLQAVRDMLPGRAPAEAIEALDIALERGDKAIAEGRDTVSDLREPILGDSDIAQALTALGNELALQSGNGLVPCVRVLLEGKQRELNPMLRDEIYRIAREALRNAFLHARAQKIEAEITYGDSEFLLHVRDDGGGIDPEVANQGARAGHWGLPGMRERAKSFGGKLEVWSEHGAGTEIELSVPGAIAYGKSEPRRRFWFWRKKNEETNGQQS
jgi:signal transduction histidine kinase/ligand-binding sensor domain-containing protein